MKEAVGYDGDIEFDRSRPDGTPRKVLDVSRIEALGWRPRYELPEGLRTTYEWAVRHGVFDGRSGDASTARDHSRSTTRS
jgi:GDP-L-fucose synthase